MKILINTTPPSGLGGVSNHYQGLKQFWTENVFYNYIGGRYKIPGIVILPYDVIKFILKSIWFRPDVVVLNPSLGKTAIKRDALFLKISKLLRLKTVVFFHGWNNIQEKEIDENPIVFTERFNKADLFLVLASSFQQKLKEWKITKTIRLTTTKVDDQLLNGFDINKKKNSYTILFLARIEPEKGIFIALEAFKQIKENYPKAKLIVAGDGSALKEAKEIVIKENISNVFFKGYLRGEQLKSVFKKANIYIFPTMHGEGMPTSVLEAMGFGLAIISRPIGGLVDVFKEGEMGSLVEGTTSAIFAKRIMELFSNQDNLHKISLYNHKYLIDNFLASKVASKMETHFIDLYNMNCNDRNK